MWKVSIEEQFYLFWPALMRMLKRRGMIIAGNVTFLLSTVSQIGIVLGGVAGGLLYFGSASRRTRWRWESCLPYMQIVCLNLRVAHVSLW